MVGDFQKHLGKPVILLGFGLMDDNIHSPNEKYAVACYEKGVEASIRFWGIAGLVVQATCAMTLPMSLGVAPVANMARISNSTDTD